MPLTKVLIQFVSQNPAENVISAAALAPEILIPVGYGSYMTEAMRSRYNYFFHRRRISTIMAEPVHRGVAAGKRLAVANDSSVEL